MLNFFLSVSGESWPRHALASLVRLAVHTLGSQRGTVAFSSSSRGKRERQQEEKMRLSPMKPSPAVGNLSSRAAVAPARAMLSASAATLKSYASAPLLASTSSARNGAVAQASASSSNNGAAAAERRRPQRRRIASLRALPTATSPSSEASSPRQRSPKVTTTSSAVPAPPSLQRGASSPSTLLNNNRAPLPAPPADGAPLAHEIIKGSMVRECSGGFVV